jgi:hypothetical protein
MEKMQPSKETPQHVLLFPSNFTVAKKKIQGTKQLR